MLRWYGEMRSVCERHGGSVRELIGDAVMAVFGIPEVHEDDALRAVRAAVEMRDRLDELDEQLERDFGVRLLSRTGVNTGEVVVRDPNPDGALALGDPVNVAARLQSTAEPGEILLGELTYRLVRNAVRTRSVDSLELKGKAAPVSSYRLLELLPEVEGWTRDFETPLVGRELELDELCHEFRRVVRERRCHLVTVFGAAGMGKTRLAHELARSVGAEATVLTGRCLSYGEGITYSPLREIVKRAEGGRGLPALLGGSPDADAVVTGLEQAIGTGSGVAVKEETFWAVRRLAEHLAREKPLVLVFEDIHWGEPTLLDLIEQLADLIRDAPVLVLCLARPELLETRSSWGGGKLNAATILLAPLSEEESTELVSALPTGTGLAPGDRARIEQAAGGNPLFLEQMLAMLSEVGQAEGEIAVPPAIQALLSARLGRLDRAERAVLERASIEGESFHLRSVLDLTPQDERGAVVSHLESLVRKELIRSEDSAPAAGDTFGFRHALIREAAYDALPKAARSDLHERHATWLEGTLGSRVSEAEEILGYHLEQAYRYRSELGAADIDHDLARRAFEYLAAGGRRAWQRTDTSAAANLLQRASTLLPEDDPLRLELLPELGMALFSLGRPHADAVLQEAVERGRATGNRGVTSKAAISRSYERLYNEPGNVDIDELARQTEQAVDTLAKLGDDSGLARSWFLLHEIRFLNGEAAGAEQAAEHAIDHAHRSASDYEELEGLVELGWALWYGPTRVADGIRRCADLLTTRQTNRAFNAALLTILDHSARWQATFEGLVPTSSRASG